MNLKAAIKIAIEAIEYRQRNYVVGYTAFLQGTSFAFAKRDHKEYLKLNEAKEMIKEVIDV